MRCWAGTVQVYRDDPGSARVTTVNINGPIGPVNVMEPFMSYEGKEAVMVVRSADEEAKYQAALSVLIGAAKRDAKVMRARRPRGADGIELAIDLITAEREGIH
jgi:hypothetical protein